MGFNSGFKGLRAIIEVCYVSPQSHIPVDNIIVYLLLYPFQNIFLHCPTPSLHCFLSSHWPSFRFLSFMAFLIPSIKFFFGLSRALFCFGIHFNAILGNLPSAILWTWPYHVSWFCTIYFIIVSSSPICCLIVTFLILPFLDILEELSSIPNINSCQEIKIFQENLLVMVAHFFFPSYLSATKIYGLCRVLSFILFIGPCCHHYRDVLKRNFVAIDIFQAYNTASNSRRQSSTYSVL